MSENRIQKDMIFTENPEEEMWQTILQFSYDANIRRFLIKNSFEESETLINNISGSILQAYEYYKSAKIANLQIKPLLLYYGTTNLLYGITNMLTGRINEIHDHGMKTIVVDDAIFIGDTEVSFNDPDFGGIHVFMNAFNVGVDLSKHGKWNVKETLSSIPELHIDYLKCYDEKFSNNFFLSEYNTPEGKIKKINIENLDIEQVFEMLSNVVGFKENYLSYCWRLIPNYIINEIHQKALQYGEYVDWLLYGIKGEENYYTANVCEAIGKGNWGGTADEIAYYIANGFRNSKGHWSYVGSSKYTYMAVGAIYDGYYWYVCVCMDSENTDLK